MGVMAPRKIKPKTPFAAKLQRVRKKHGELTQAQAADRIGVALRTLISWENGHRVPSGPALALLKIAFPDDFK